MKTEKGKRGIDFLSWIDGLQHIVSDDKIKKILEAFLPESDACAGLVKDVTMRDGRDKVNILAVHRNIKSIKSFLE